MTCVGGKRMNKNYFLVISPGTIIKVGINKPADYRAEKVEYTEGACHDNVTNSNRKRIVSRQGDSF